MADRLPWFPCYPSKLLGALSAMQPQEGYLYWIICLRIYEVNGPCRDDVNALRRRTGMTKRQIDDGLDRLFLSGKLVRTDAGITNPFADTVLASSREHQERLRKAGSEGGKKSGEKRKEKQYEGPSQASLPLQPTSTKSTSTITEDSEGAKAPSRIEPDPTDVRTELFRRGLGTLVQITGKMESSCRPLIGKWLKRTDDDCVLVLRAIEDAARNRVDGPIAWIEGAIRSKTGGGNGETRNGGRGGFGTLRAKLRAGADDPAPDGHHPTGAR